MLIFKINPCAYTTFVVVICINVCFSFAEENVISVEQIDFFEKKIRPVLVEDCYECHAVDAKAVRGGLLVDSAVAFRTGGDSGPAVVPGKPSDGTLLEALKHETFEMPPKQKLPDAVIKNFEDWIAMGAPDPRTQATTPASVGSGIDLAAGREFWSFQPIREPEIPTVNNANWAVSDIDRFILAAQAKKNLQPGLAADSLTALRRLYIDLIGLPPTVEQIHQFEAHDEKDRWQHTIDELLESQQFGERWGRHWLDLARYSNSTGGGRSLLYGESWRYRNYVIDSFNNDKPFDQFIREQIAGDLLVSEDYKVRQQQIIGTGFLALGPHNYENQDKEQLRMDVVDEQIDTVGRVFLGMTIGCARCHDHKFDPIPTTDYYALAGIFRSTNSLVPGNVSKWVSTPSPISVEEETERDAYKVAVSTINTKIKKLQTKIKDLKVGLPSIVMDNPAATLVGAWTDSTSVKGYVNENYQHSSELTASAEYLFAVDEGEYEIQISYTPGSNRTQKAKVTVDHAEGNKELSINQRLQPSLDGTYHSLGNFSSNGELKIIIQPTEKAPTIIDAVRLISLNENEEETTKQIQTALKETEVELKQRQTELAELEKSKPAELPQIVSVAEQPEPSDYNVNIRGNPHNLGEDVPRGFLSVVESSEQFKISENESGRLELANWIANRENTLTARVFVNRVWKHLFNVGLVRTVDNFGVPGEKPSHPELLDHLAVQFMMNNWSVKQLVREIVLSQTYQLASATAGSIQADPENRLLTHQNKRRLTAEAIHDAMFLISGELDLTPGGDTIRSGTKSEYGYQFDFGKRAVYLPVFRNRLPDLFAVFDFPNPNLPQGKRTASNISPQSLFLMNSEFVSQRSQQTATQVIQKANSTEDRIERLSLAILNRYPTSDEQRLLTEFIGVEPESIERWTQVVQALFGSLDFRFVE